MKKIIIILLITFLFAIFGALYWVKQSKEKETRRIAIKIINALMEKDLLLAEKELNVLKTISPNSIDYKYASGRVDELKESQKNAYEQKKVAKEYAKNNVVIYKDKIVDVEFLGTIFKGQIKNLGDKYIKNPSVKVFFLDNEDSVISDRTIDPLSSPRTFDYHPVLKPGYIQKFSYEITGLPDEWSGKYRFEIISVEFINDVDVK